MACTNVFSLGLWGVTTVKLRYWRRLAVLLAVLFLSGCAQGDGPQWILNPNGPIARASILYLAIDVGLLLIIIAPTTVLVFWAMWHYRRGNKRASYSPGFTRSKLLEVVMWGGPILLVGALSYYSVQGSFALDPYHPGSLANVDPTPGAKPLHIKVITTDWQWLFVYPKQGIAVSNKLVLPAGRKIDLDLTSAGVTNDFYIQRIVNQIYIMPGMHTERHFFLQRTGNYKGYSTAFSGPGFSWMNYPVRAVTPAQFRSWVKKARQTGRQLTVARFNKFAQPTINTGHVSLLFNHVAPHLFDTVIHEVKTGRLPPARPPRIAENMHGQRFKSHAN